MRILIASAVYPPEPVVSARLSADLREYLAAQGHEAKVICPQPSRGVAKEGERGEGRQTLKSGKLKAESGSKPELRAQDREQWGQDSAPRTSGEASIVRVSSYRCRESRLWGRARESWDFGRHVAQWLRRNGNPFDVIYGNMWPLFGPYRVTRAARLLAVPVVHHVQDVYPESLATKVPPRIYRLAAPLLLRLDRAVVKRCAGVVLLSDRISRDYAQTRGIADRVHVVRNWEDDAAFKQPHDRAAVCREYQVPADRFTFMYLGNLSALSALESVIEAFGRVARPDRQLVIVGEGSAKDACQQRARRLGLDSVLFRLEPEVGRVARAQAMADVFLMPTRRGAARSSTPSKCISYMFSGKPILAAVDAASDAADDIRHADCGWVCEPESVAAMASMMEQSAVIPANLRAAMGANARRYAEHNFSKETGVATLSGIILAAARRNAAA